jgi:hypothetical protein
MEITIPTRQRRAAGGLASRQLLLAGVTIAATLIAGLALVRPLALGSPPAAFGDTSYDQVEMTRSQLWSVPGHDTSYDQVEMTRSQLWSVPGHDTSYDQVEKPRSQIGLPNAVEDRSYDEIERIRSHAGS